MDTENLTLLDVIDVHKLQSLQDAFANATGMSALAVDENGAVTRVSNPTEFCMSLTRRTPSGCERCNKCDLQGGDAAARTGRPSVYSCHSGLVDFAVPIMLNGRHIGSLIGGQVLTEEPNEAKFRRIAKEIGVDEEQYIRALHKVPVVSKERVDAAANLLYQVANALSEIGCQRATAQEHTGQRGNIENEINERFHNINEQTEKTVKSIKNLAENFTAISSAASASVKAIENTDNIVKGIESASTQLTLIGFNASIEAKRAGAAGEGFNVIAQEVRTLADKTTKQTTQIENTLADIRKSMKDINEQVKSVKTAIEQNQAVIESLSGELADVSELISKSGL